MLIKPIKLLFGFIDADLAVLLPLNLNCETRETQMVSKSSVFFVDLF